VGSRVGAAVGEAVGSKVGGAVGYCHDDSHQITLRCQESGDMGGVPP
jgi:hypothetical protein